MHKNITWADLEGGCRGWSCVRIQTQWWEVCGYFKIKHARRGSPQLSKTRTSLRRKWGLVWIWPLLIYHVALSKPQRRGSVDVRWDNILIKKAVEEKFKEKVEDKRWQERLLWTRWEDDQLSEHRCFAWLSGWACAPTYTITEVIYGALWTALTNPNLCGI